MAKSPSSGGTSNRALMEAIVFLILGLLAVGEFYWAFKQWTPILDRWVQRNPVTAPLLLLGLMMTPLAAFLAMKSSGTEMGKDAEDIRRSMRK